MRWKGVSYDVGSVMGFNWRPDFKSEEVKRELQIIKEDLHCNAVRISGEDLGRVSLASRYALDAGLEVWFYPTLWDKSPAETLQYLARAAKEAEALRQSGENEIVFVAGGELTLFMQGIIAGKRFKERLSNPGLFSSIRAGAHNKPLNEFLSKANSSVRSAFHGRVTYCSLVWEKVDWGLFEYIGVDHYRAAKIEDRYVELLNPLLSQGKPVVVTEFGHATTRGGPFEEGFLSTSGLGGNIIDTTSQAIHYAIPVVGHLVRPHLIGEHVRDEAWQAQKIVETLTILDQAGVAGAFVSGFISQINPYNDVPRYDLDMAGTSLVKYFEGGRRGTTYPDMPWEPKESFRAVASYFASH